LNKRIYVCHTFYHVYITVLKELLLKRQGDANRAHLVLSLMSNDFGDLKNRAEASGLFLSVTEFDEKPDTYFEELAPLKRDTGNIVTNMLNRIKFCKEFPRLEEDFVPVNFSEYDDIYVFCDSDPIGYYLNYKGIYYHALEDGLNCLVHTDSARFDNRSFFTLKSWFAKMGLIHIQNGWSRYCIDMEVNDISALKYPCPKYIEKKRSELTSDLTDNDKEIILSIFSEDADEITRLVKGNTSSGERILVLTEPLCDNDTRVRIFNDILSEYGSEGDVMVKVHPRDKVDYTNSLKNCIILSGDFPMEILDFLLEKDFFDKVISVYTVTDNLAFAREKIILGNDFMDKYEDPGIHRKADIIEGKL